jgi:hypothetical protein
MSKKSNKKFDNTKKPRRRPAGRIIIPSIVGIALAGLAHGLFKFLTFSHPLRILSALLILVIWIWGIRILEKQAVAADGPQPPASGAFA